MNQRGPWLELCEVLSHRRSGAYHTLSLVAPRIAGAARAGQFAGLLAGTDRSFLLRRLPERATACLLVGGGYGAAPLFLLAEELRVRGCRIDFLVGASTTERLFKAIEAKRLGRTAVVTTDDGSSGRRGLVTDPMPALMAQARTKMVYACGPMPMLAAVSRVAAAAGVPCQVAVEELMACGTGICFSCVIPMLDPSSQGSTRMARSCTEGPVLDGAAIAWEEVGS